MTIFKEISRKEQKLRNEIKILEDALRDKRLRDPYFWTILENAIIIWPNLETAIDNTIWHKKQLLMLLFCELYSHLHANISQNNAKDRLIKTKHESNENRNKQVQSK